MRLHFLSNSLHVNSGFSKVTLNLVLGLKKLGHDVSMTGLQTTVKTDYYHGIECLPIDVGGDIDETGQLLLNIQKIQPDVLIYVEQMDIDLNFLTKVFGKTICAIPIEGMNIPIGMVSDLKYVVDHGGLIVASCKYGQEEMKKVGIDGYMIYYGYDPDIFKRINNINNKYEYMYCYYRTSVGQVCTDPLMLCKMGCYECKKINIDIRDQLNCTNYKEEIVSILNWDVTEKRWTQRNIGIGKLYDDISFKGKFIYLLVGQNIGLRKRIERLLRSYSILISESKQLKDRTHLHLHTLPISIRGINLVSVIHELGIESNVSFSYGTFRSSGWSEEGLNVLYNLADVNVSATSGEGFGMPHLESMACGIPNIAPNCSSLTELIGYGEKARGLLADIESSQMIQNGSIRILVSEQDLADKMKRLYTDDKLREKLGKNGTEWAKDYTWKNVVQQWDRLLEEMKGRNEKNKK